MATIGKVAAIFSASSSGLSSGVRDATRSFRQLGGDAANLGGAFARLQAISGRGVGAIGPAADIAAARLKVFQSLSERLQASLAAGSISAEEFARKMELIRSSAETLSASLARGASITEQFESAESKHARTMQELSGLLKSGAISEDTYALAADHAADELERAARSTDKFGKETTQASTGARKMATATGTADNALSKINSKLNALITIQAAQLFGSIASAASNAVRSLIGMGNAEAQTIDRTSKLADRLGMTYGELSGIALAGELAGVGMESIAKAATKGDIAFAKLAEGSQVAQQAFGLVGLTLEDLNGKTSAERFAAISDAIAALPTEAERARAAVSLFGKAGAELLPLFNEGSASVSETALQAERLGLALTNDQGRAVESMNDSFDLARSTISGVVGQVTAYLAPALQEVSDTFVRLVGDIGGANIGQFIGDGILRGAEFLATIADGFIASFLEAWNYASSVGADWEGVWDVGRRVASFFAGIGNALTVAFGTLTIGFTGVVELVLKAAKSILDAVGMENQAVNNLAAGAEGFNDSIRQTTLQAADNMAKNFSDAFGTQQQKATAAAAGPIASALRDAIARAQANATSTSVAKPQTLTDKGPQPFTGTSAAELRATDSRSREGVAEMFRLMRGEQNDIPQKSLDMLTQIHLDLMEHGDGMLVEIGAN